MVKRKSQEADDMEGDQMIPLPIQAFFWRQTCPFIRPKLGKLCEASCVSFERVVVQNILHGLSPSLCEAIQSVSRWKVIQASFPHVMHSCSSLLATRKQTNPHAKFVSSEIKLLYTLHWILLDAASECEDLDAEWLGANHKQHTYMQPLSAVQLFIYLFAPLVHTLKDSDFQSLKLENGLRLWQPLLEYRQPDIPCFSTPVKPQRNVLKAQRNLLKVNTNAANIYIGKGCSTEHLYLGFECSSRTSVNEPASPLAPLARMSDICAMSTSDSQSVTVDMVCDYCNSVMPIRVTGEGTGPVCKCGRKDSFAAFPFDSRNTILQRMMSPIDNEYMKSQLTSAMTCGIRGPTVPDVMSASYFDVAVLKCLFCLQWSEDGVYWALKYVHQRLLEFCDEFLRKDISIRERSRSLPVPDIQVLQAQSKPNSPLDTGENAFTPSNSALWERKCSGSGDSFKNNLTTPLDNQQTPPPTATDRKEPPFKRIRVIDIKHYFETGKTFLKKKDEVDEAECQSPKGSRHDGSHMVNKGFRDDSCSTLSMSTLDTDPELLPRPSSAMGNLLDVDLKEPSLSSDDDRRRSMPSLRQTERDSLEASSQPSSSRSSSESTQVDTAPTGFNLRLDQLTKPIITITEHSPEPPSPLPSFYNLTRKRGSIEIDRLEADHGSQTSSSSPLNNMSRSLTDSNIVYVREDEIPEVSGSLYYIQKENGHMNYRVVLKAVHFVSLKDKSPRVCEVLLNMISCLLDLEIFETKKTGKKDGEDEQKQRQDEASAKGEMTAHGLAMDSLIRIYKALGCPHGCGDGVRGIHGDHLRIKGQNSLQRLQRINPPEFRHYIREFVKKHPVQDVIDFLHAFLGFCIDPPVVLHSPQSHPRKSASQEGLSRNGFVNNFGQSIGGVGYRGVEGVLIASILKSFVSKCVEGIKELNSHENISIFCDIRQLMSYIREIHGGTYRRVLLGGLMDACFKPEKKQQPKPDARKGGSISVRRTTSITSESGEEKDGRGSPIMHVQDDGGPDKKSRQSLFKKKIKKPVAMPYSAASDSEIFDESGHSKLNPRMSMSGGEDDFLATPKRKFSRFQIGWKRGTKSDHEDDGNSDTPTLDRRESKSELQFHRVKGKMSFKAASQATLTFLSARRRIEEGLKTLGKRMSKRGSADDSGRRAADLAGSLGTEVTIMREKKLVDKYLIKSGMLRFSFLLECSNPGCVPDPQLVAAMLELEAPVSARAALLLECAQFVYRCNHGDWPSWMKLNLPTFRHSNAALHNRGQPSGYRRNLMIQRAAGRMFYSWAENLGSQLEYILAREHKDRLSVINDVKEEARRKDLRVEDDEENFLDEATVNISGSDCPYALKMVACLVLSEITTFMRETFQYLPRAKTQRRDMGWERNISNRRWSSIVSSPGHSDKSSESNIAELPQTAVVGSPGDRKISFAILTERSDSLHSSNASLSAIDGGEERKGRRLAQGRQKLLKHFRRGSGHNTSFRQNRSFKFKRQEGGSMKRVGSIRTRKVSSQSLKSDEKFGDEEQVEDAESVGMHSDETQESPADHQENDDHIFSHNMPWMKVVIQIANLSNFVCNHQNFCHPHCYERQRRSCSRLVTAVKKIYESTELDKERDMEKRQDARRDIFREKLKRRESIFQQSSPIRRRESTPLLEKIRTDVSLTKLKLSPNWKKEEKPKEVKEDLPIVKYIISQAQNLTQCPMTILTKAAPILTERNFVDIMPVAWELLLESDQELSATAASVFLLSSIKAPDTALTMITKELQHEEIGQRINAILRFNSLWKFRYQVWPRMEEGANALFKIPPPGIDFTLPSPTIGMPSQTVIDPPWTPHFKAKIEEVTVDQEETKSLVTATTTRRKQQQEMIHKALLAEEERKRVGRETFPLMTIPVTQLAAYEPALHHVMEEHEEALQEEINLAARRVSLAPVNRANIQSRSMSWRNGSLHWGRFTNEGEEERAEHAHHMQLAQSFFPSCICSAILPIIHLLDDCDVNGDGIAVSEVAAKIIWSCIVDDPVLFLRHFLEKLTNKDKQEELLFLLRKLLLHYRGIPGQIAHSLFNYMIGYMMFYVRSPCEGGQEALAGALAILHQVVPNVEGIYFKDLKQTLKKEQCDPYLMISANVPSAKKIIVHGPDLSSIPSQYPIHEDTQFSHILHESLDFFNIPEDQHGSYFLVDTKSNQMHNLNSYVRDFYFFRRNFYPQLSLVHMNPDTASQTQQSQALILKFGEVGKVLFATKILLGTPIHQMPNHVAFLHEELMKLPSFPRKALEAEFGLYHGHYGKELYGLDTLHKYAWVKLMSTMFTSMSSTFTWSNDLPLFLNVINGTVILHGEDTALLRFCLSVLINTARHFKHIFATNGFLYIMPTLLRVYSNNQPNPVLCMAIHFVCKQFYVLHRKPFILQMFGSIAPMLDMNSDLSGMIDCNKIQPDCLFKLLLALEKDCKDNLGVLDLVFGEKPLKALDFCYEASPDTFNMVDVINMCVTVIAYAPDSFRAVQMLTVLEVVVPRYLQYLKTETNRRDNPAAARAEINIITNIGISVRALISCCEIFTRNMSVPQRHLEGVSANVKPSQNHSNHSPQGKGIYFDEREDSHASRHMEEGRKKQYIQYLEDIDVRTEFRKPRDSLLCVAAEFYGTCQLRLKELRKMLADPTFRPPELIDNKAHNRLADITHTLLKLAPYDPITMGCSGLQRYITEILPITDWSQEAVRPALNLILRRLDRLFSKISKKQFLRRQVDWEAAANLLRGVHLTLSRFKYIAHLPHLKTLINVLINIILSGSGGALIMGDNPGGPTGHKAEHNRMVAPPSFCSAVIKVAATQMQALGDQYSLEQICGGMSVFPTMERSLHMLVSFILPLCVRVGSGRRDAVRLRPIDINFALTVILNAIDPPTKLPTQSGGGSKSHHLSVSDQGRSNSISQSDKSRLKNSNELLQQAAFLGLEILMVCFDKVLAAEWHHVTKTIQEIGEKTKGSLSMWKFLDFVVTHRPAIFLLLQPFISFKMLRLNCDTAQEYYLQQTIKDKLSGHLTHPKCNGSVLIQLAMELRQIRDELNTVGVGKILEVKEMLRGHLTHPKCNGSVLIQLAMELRQIRDELNTVGVCEYRSRTATMATERSDYSHGHNADHMHRASITEITADIIPMKPMLGSVGKRPSRATILSMSSSNASGAMRTAVPSSGASSSSPLLSRRRSSKRIFAQEGSRILEKFMKKSILGDDTGQDLQTPQSPKLQRQSSFTYRGIFNKQPSLDSDPASILYENEAEAANGAAYSQAEAKRDLPTNGSTDLEPRAHRLQRQDAKSRKTFKIKRSKTKTTSTKGRILPRIGRQDHSDGESGSTEDSPTHPASPTTFLPERAMLQLRRSGGTGTAIGQMPARSVETIPETVEAKPASSRPRYVPRSKSHDAADGHAPAGTVRGRIARHGVRVTGSRSPSTSPVLPARSLHGQAYVARCESSESLPTNESSALLREEDKTISQNSLCLYFDDCDTVISLHDTMV